MLRTLSLLVLLTGCGSGLVNTNIGDGDDKVDGGVPNVYLPTSALDFGEVAKGATASEGLILQNTGTGTLTVESLTFDDASFFASAGAGLQVAAGSSTTLSVKFLPVDFLAHEGTLVITTDDPDSPELSVTLRGSVIVDEDGDGFSGEAAGGDDCDDEDPTIHPEADDAWYDGVDSNCDGSDDYDQDGDGFQTLAYNPVAGAGGGDCQDTNPAMYPGAEDAWYDGVDSNCDGVDDFDQDGDGFESAAHGRGDDCDDSDPLINPDNLEKLNGFDDDCDGEVDGKVNAWDADYAWRGTAGSDQAGTALLMGDLDDDGIDDIVIGASGYQSSRGLIGVIEGRALPATGSDITAGRNDFFGDTANDQLGAALSYHASIGYDGDPAVAIGAPGYGGSQGMVYVIAGEDVLLGGDTTDAFITVSGGSGHFFVGRNLASGLDLNADGLEDLLGTHQTSSSTTSGTPELWLLYGDAAGSYSLSTVDARYTTSDGSGRTMLSGPPPVGDVDGDGVTDAIFCDHLSDYGNSNNGVVWALWGSATPYATSSSTNIESTATVISSGGNYDRHGYVCGVSPDLDGDGDDELWVYEPGQESLWAVAGGLHLRDGNIDPADYAIVTYEWSATGSLPGGIQTIGDFDGDGRPEVAVSVAPGSDVGSVRIYASGTRGSGLDAGRGALAEVSGESDSTAGHYNVRFGSVMSARPGDVNGDGAPDFLAADPGWGDPSSGSATKGEVYLTLGVP